MLGRRPLSTTVLTGRANATAIVSLIAVTPAGPGYLQVLPCGATPGSTSNVNYDTDGDIADVRALDTRAH